DQNISGLAVGTYNLVVRDANGCIGGLSRTITQATQIVINQSSTNVSCFGGSTGAINLTVAGGTGSYTYSWTRNNSTFSGNNTEDLSSQPAGTYVVTVTDVPANCTATATVILTQPAAAVSGTPVVTNVSCNSGATGQIILTPTGGTAPYTFAWTATSGGIVPSGQATNKDLSLLVAGTYSVTITDARGCTSTINNIDITQPTPIVVGTPAVTPVNCFGGTTGAISIAASGGTGTLTYQWSNGATTNTVTGLAAGTYFVIVRDANGCTVNSGNIAVGQPAELTVSTTPTAVTCFGGTNGGVTTIVNGGTTNYTYLWSNNAATADLTNVAAGNYQVTVTDARGCTAISTATVTSPTALVLSGTVTNVLCNGASTGAITLSNTGGTGTLTYDWADIAGTDNPQNRTNLAAGTYSVTVSDANGCTDAKSYTVTESAPLATSFVNTNISCNGGSDGAIDLSVSGGVGPYTYLWSNGANTEDITGLAAGPYSVTVTDANSCSATFNAADITHPDVLTLSVTADKATDCFGGADGGAAATPTGGTAPYTYQWSDGGSGAVRTNLLAGNYTVTVTDIKGCTAQSTVTITQPDELEVFAEVTNNNGCGQAPSGSIVLTAQAGTVPYSYAWTRTGGGFSAITKDISGLSAGTYTVTVTDNKGCTKQLTSIVGTEASTLAVTISKTDITCFGFPNNINGTATVAPTGGTLPYTYDWAGTPTGDGTPFITGLAAGSYSVTVTDAGGCTASTSVTINGTTCTVPVAVDDTLRQCNGAAITGTVATNDNINGVPLAQMTFINLGVALQAQGELVWNNTFDGTFTFTPSPTFSGTFVLPYKVEDQFGVSDTANLVIIISRLDLSLAAATVVDATCSTQGSITIPEPTSGT
ncbi:MAG: hypothetical protein EAY75_01095, partial [Bacteroidetes bacterium]